MQAPDHRLRQPKATRARRGPATLAHPAPRRFRLAVVLIGVAAGVDAARRRSFSRRCSIGSGPANVDLLQAASGAGFWRHVVILTGAGIVTGIGQILPAVYLPETASRSHRQSGFQPAGCRRCDLGQRLAVGDHRRHGGFARARRRAQAGRRRDRQRRMRPFRLVGRSAEIAGRVRRRRGNGRGLRCPAGRRAVRNRSVARRVGAAVGAAGADLLGDRDHRRMDRSSQCPDLSCRRARQFRVSHRLGAARRADHRGRLGRLCQDDSVCGSQPAEGLAAAGRARFGVRDARVGLGPFPQLSGTAKISPSSLSTRRPGRRRYWRCSC